MLVSMGELLAVVGSLLLASLSEPPSARVEIERHQQAYAEAFKKGDVATLLAFFEDDAIRIVPGRTLKGRDEIRGAFERVAKGGFKILALSFKTEDLRVIGDLAQEVGLTSGENELADGRHITWTGRYLTVWHRGPDGRWRVQSDASFFNPPPKS
jgi:uncharacterized protein (TIGR02246 family)